MNESREFNAATVEEALARASRDLSLPEEELSYEVLDTGSDGFLGIGARDARIKVSFDSASVSPSISTEEVTDEEPSVFSEDAVLSTESSEPSFAVENSELQRGLDRESDEEKRNETVVAPEHLIEEVRNYVSSVVEAMGLDARLDVYDTEEYIAVDVASDHAALIIGQKGETIDSLQYLANSSIYKDREFVKRIVLDSEGYRQRRIEAIQGMAHRTARKSIREQREIKMPPMNSSERRVVHVYLKENPRVTTHSEGSGSERRVTVSPSQD